MDVDRMEHAIPPGAYVFTDKRVVRRAIEKANIPYTYISANCCAGYFLGALAQLGHFMPPTDHALIYGDGDKKCRSSVIILYWAQAQLSQAHSLNHFLDAVAGIWVDEDDMAMYAMMAVDDPRALNKTLYLRPRANILTQMEVVHTWEKIIGKELKKTFVSQDEWLSSIDSK